MADINDLPLYMGFGRLNASVDFGLKQTGAPGATWKRLECKINLCAAG